MQKARPIYDWAKVPLVIDVPYACVILGVTYDTLLRRIKKGELKAFRVGKVAMQTKIDEFATFVKKRLIERHRYLYG